MEARLIYDPPANGAWNMAIDEVMLDAVTTSGQPILRFYTWEHPTLSLGYFQEHRDRSRHQASFDCAWLRRSTGGGAILHDGELTYSFVVPAHARSASETRRLYDAFHETLVEVLWQLYHTTAGLHSGEQGSPDRHEPFLCFQRRSPGDVILHRHKVAGSAQRRHRGALLQHGSILLRGSRFAPELPGLSDLIGKDVEANVLRDAWKNRLATRLDVEFHLDTWGELEREAASQVASLRFGAFQWNERR